MKDERVIKGKFEQNGIRLSWSLTFGGGVQREEEERIRKEVEEEEEEEKEEERYENYL